MPSFTSFKNVFAFGTPVPCFPQVILPSSSSRLRVALLYLGYLPSGADQVNRGTNFPSYVRILVNVYEALRRPLFAWSGVPFHFPRGSPSGFLYDASAFSVLTSRLNLAADLSFAYTITYSCCVDMNALSFDLVYLLCHTTSDTMLSSPNRSSSNSRRRCTSSSPMDMKITPSCARSRRATCSREYIIVSHFKWGTLSLYMRSFFVL